MSLGYEKKNHKVEQCTFNPNLTDSSTRTSLAYEKLVEFQLFPASLSFRSSEVQQISHVKKRDTKNLKLKRKLQLRLRYGFYVGKLHSIPYSTIAKLYSVKKHIIS